MKTNLPTEIATRTPGTDARRCPSLVVSAHPSAQKNTIPLKGAPSLIDALYAGGVVAAHQRMAIHAGTIRARKAWYDLRRVCLRVERLAARQGLTLQWGQPWPTEGQAVYAYLVRGEQVIGEGQIYAYDRTRADVIIRRMIKAKN